MAASKKPIKTKNPTGRVISIQNDPDSFYKLHPSWRFARCDHECWSIDTLREDPLFWDEIMPRLRDFETQTWGEILIRDKKHNHLIYVQDLNTGARQRLDHGLDAIYSLRVTGTHRIYGDITNGVFSIIWIDLEHGNNSTCVCRSHLKHT